MLLPIPVFEIIDNRYPLDIRRLIGDLRERADIQLERASLEPIGGGSVNRAYRLASNQVTLFVKTNARSALGMFEAEALGLAALEKIEAVRVPRVFAVGTVGDAAYLALEWIEFAAKSAEAEAELGRGLALQHRSTSTTFGWSRDNTIGSTPQLNRPCTDWPAFLRERRLRYQLDLAGRNGLPSSILGRGLSLLEQLDEFLGDHRPTPSLLHGDLWGGNWAATRAGVPFIFDPAVYYGDREADIAMTRLFGGFGDAFYAAYEAEWPLPASSERRVDLYNLYHLLNHFNLFGAGYLEAVQASIGRLERGARERS